MELARNVVAIELLCAAQALEQHRPLRSGAGVEAAYVRLRARPSAHRRPPAPDIAALARMIEEGGFEGLIEDSAM